MSNKFKLVILILVIVVVKIVSYGNSGAGNNISTEVVDYNNVVEVDNKITEDLSEGIKYSEYELVYKDNYKMGPIRIISEKLDSHVTINNNINSIVLKKDNQTISFDRSFPRVKVNGKYYKTGVLPYVYKEDLYVPLKYIENTLGVEIDIKDSYFVAYALKNKEVLKDDTKGYDNIVSSIGSKGEFYIEGILIVNKQFSVSEKYTADDYNVEIVKRAFNQMKIDALKDSIQLDIISWVRAIDKQTEIYDYYVNRDGVEVANTKAAIPGHSEHHTGLAIDINSVEDSFGGTPEGIWVSKNCYKYGFIVRYPEGKTHVTGYKYEPWHLRYVGVDIASEIHSSGVTLEEYLNIQQ